MVREVSARTEGAASCIMGCRTAGGRREAGASARAAETPPGAPQPGGTRGAAAPSAPRPPRFVPPPSLHRASPGAEARPPVLPSLTVDDFAQLLFALVLEELRGEP